MTGSPSLEDAFFFRLAWEKAEKNICIRFLFMGRKNAKKMTKTFHTQNPDLKPISGSSTQDRMWWEMQFGEKSKVKQI